MSGLADRVRIARRLPTPSLCRATREAAGVSQAEIARELGVAQPTISAWETSRWGIAPEHVEAYVALLDDLRAAMSS